MSRALSAAVLTVVLASSLVAAAPSGDHGKGHKAVLPTAFVPAFLGCPVMASAWTVPASAIQVPAGWELATPVAGLAQLHVLSGSCIGVVLDDKTSVAPASFTLVYVDVHAPAPYAHPADAILLQVISDVPRIVQEAGKLGVNAVAGSSLASVTEGVLAQNQITTTTGTTTIVAPFNGIAPTTQTTHVALHWFQDGKHGPTHQARILAGVADAGGPEAAVSAQMLGGAVQTGTVGTAVNQNGDFGIAIE
jgi:hypothetical protein